jgi:hypothetical protein
MKKKNHQIVLLPFLVNLFLMFPLVLQAEALDLDKFFKINPNEISSDIFDQYISTPWKSMDDNNNIQIPGLDDYKKASLIVEGHKANIIIGKATLSKRTRITLIINVSYERGCRWFLDKAMNLYGRKTLHYYDSSDSGLITDVNAEASFEYPDHSVSFECKSMTMKASQEVVIPYLTLYSGDKTDIKKVLPRTLIMCAIKSEENDFSGSSSSKIKTFYIYIDHDDKKLLRRDGTNFMSEINEFSNEIITGKQVLSEGRRKQFFSLDRITGTYEWDIENATEKILSSLSRPLNIKIRGMCEKVKNVRKF